jgi:hypothetical protein
VGADEPVTDSEVVDDEVGAWAPMVEAGLKVDSLVKEETFTMVL